MSNARQAFADRSQSRVGGSGPGGDAISPATRERDLAAYEAQRAALPKKPPRRPSEGTPES